MHRIHLAEGLIDTFSGFFSKRVKAALSKLDELFFLPYGDGGALAGKLLFWLVSSTGGKH